MKKLILIVALIASGVLTCVVLQSNTPDPCKHLHTVFTEEVIRKSKQHPTDEVVRLIGCQRKDAYMKALNLCIKLQARKKDLYTSREVYILPAGLGHIILQEVKSDSVFMKLIIRSDCPEISLTEVQYVSLGYYNKFLNMNYRYEKDTIPHVISSGCLWCGDRKE